MYLQNTRIKRWSANDVVDKVLSNYLVINAADAIEVIRNELATCLGKFLSKEENTLPQQALKKVKLFKKTAANTIYAPFICSKFTNNERQVNTIYIYLLERIAELSIVGPP